MALRPEDRYATPRLLADDIEHWLADEPVSALPETHRDRLARWARRHRTWVQAGVGALALVTVVSIAAAGFVNQARGRAEERRKEADKQRGLVDEQRQVPVGTNQRKIAYAQKHHADLRLAQSDLHRGLSLCEQGESARGILWMARGLEDTPEDAIDLQRVIRINLNGWSQRAIPLINIFEMQGNTRAVAFSPDGKKIFTTSDDKTARLCDVATGRPLAPPFPHQGAVLAVALNLDGKTVLTGSDDQTARLWDTAAEPAHRSTLTASRRGFGRGLQCRRQDGPHGE